MKQASEPVRGKLAFLKTSLRPLLIKGNEYGCEVTLSSASLLLRWEASLGVLVDTRDSSFLDVQAD